MPSLMRLSLWAAAPPWRLACWRGSGLAALRHVSRLQRPTAMSSVGQQGPTAAAGSSINSFGQPDPSEAEGQQVVFISSQPNHGEQQQLWQQAYSQVLAFQQAHGRLPRTAATKVGPLLEGEGRLGRWCAQQRRRKDGSQGQQLSAEERAALQAIPGWEWDCALRTRNDWWQRLQEVEAFVAQPGEEAAMTAIPGWYWGQYRQQGWEPRYQAVVAFQQQHGRLPPQKGSSSQPLVDKERQLGKWCNRQRQCYKGQQQPALEPGQQAALEAIPGWHWGQQYKKGP